MERVEASNVQVKVDDEMGILSCNWKCPHCGFDNPVLTFSHDVGPLHQTDFETDQECDWCGEMVTVECHDPTPLW